MPASGSLNSVPEQIFIYDDYRLFLKDYFEEQKRLKSCFSHRYFVEKAGLSSPSFVLDILNGRYNLTMKTLPRILKGLGLNGKKARYFENLVWFNQTRKEAEKEAYRRKLSALRKTSRFYSLGMKHWKYFEDHSYALIRELAAYAPNRSPRELGAICVPPIPAHRVKEILAELCEMGLLIARPDGGYEQSRPALSTKTAPASLSRAYRHRILRMGIRAAEAMTAEQRYCAHTTLSMSKKSFTEAMAILDEARERIINLALNDQEVEKVTCLILQHFPFTEDFTGKDA
jgi:uncharacterized protein (TIGR02147 family)